MVKWNRAFVDRPMSEPDQSPRWVRFGTFDVELRTGEIRKQGARFKLQEKLFRVLALLLEHAGRIVTREELRQRLWPADTFVDFDANLNTTLNKLRQAIGDSADHPRFIETIPRRGYRFIATVEPLENGAKGEPADVETARATEAPSAELRAESGERSGRRPLLIATLVLLALVLAGVGRSEEHMSELQSRGQRVCRLLLEEKNLGVEQRSLERGYRRQPSARVHCA